MYTVIKKIAFSAAHRLTLDYESKCCRLHGHEWHVTVYVRAAELDRNGMVIDFTEIKKKVTGKLDHSYLNEVLDFNPTAENIAKWISDTLTDGRAECYRGRGLAPGVSRDVREAPRVQAPLQLVRQPLRLRGERLHRDGA